MSLKGVAVPVELPSTTFVPHCGEAGGTTCWLYIANVRVSHLSFGPDPSVCVWMDDDVATI
jgi:hypothetical protein